MRISTSLFYQNGLNGILDQQAKLASLQSQLSSGNRVQTPGDDPLAAAQAVNVGQSSSQNDALASNRATANQALGTEENTLSSVTTAMQTTLQQVIQAGNGTLSDPDRQALVTTLTSLRDQLVGLANTTDGNGQYLFSGYQGFTQPYVMNSTTGQVSYMGDTGQRMIQVEQARQLSSSDIGTDVFNRVSPGTIAYITTGSSANTGSGVLQDASVGVPSSSNNVGKNFQVDFATGAGGAMGYTITMTDPKNPSAAPVTSAWTAYTSGSPIAMPGGGVSFAVTGAPAAGDSFTLDVPQNGQGTNMDMFNTLNNLINTLSKPSDGNQVTTAAITNMLTTANKALNLNYNNILTVRSSIGSRMNELDALNATGTQKGLSYTKQMSDLKDVDIYSVTTNLQLRQVALQAAIQSFSLVQSSSLFSMTGGK